MGTEQSDIIYNPIWIEKYYYTLPLWRRILARYFERFKITKKEYDENWFEALNN